MPTISPAPVEALLNGAATTMPAHKANAENNAIRADGLLRVLEKTVILDAESNARLSSPHPCSHGTTPANMGQWSDNGRYAALEFITPSPKDHRSFIQFSKNCRLMSERLETEAVDAAREFLVAFAAHEISTSVHSRIASPFTTIQRLGWVKALRFQDRGAHAIAESIAFSLTEAGRRRSTGDAGTFDRARSAFQTITEASGDDDVELAECALKMLVTDAQALQPQDDSFFVLNPFAS